MSANLIEANEINYLLKYAEQNKISVYHQKEQKHIAKDLTKYGKVLLKENLKSIHSRYGKDCGDDNKPNEYVYPFENQSPIQFDLFQVIYSCRYYGYQTCEHDSYKKSLAFKIIEAIEENAIYHLLEIHKKTDNIEWGFPILKIE